MKEVKVVELFFEKKENKNKDFIERIILEKYNQYYRLAYSYVHNETDAYDIVQSGACKALQSSQTLKQLEYAETWIYRIMLNECFRHLKQPKLFSYESMREEDGLDLGYKEDHYIDIDLQKALDALPHKDKAIVILRYFEDKSLEEIADILGENISTIKSKLYRSMKKLRGTLSSDSNQNVI